MDGKGSRLNEKILELTLEIIHLLTGEDYGPLKTFDHQVTPSCQHIFEKLDTTKSPTMVPPSLLLLHERYNDKKILELANKITELLTGEISIRYEDIMVYFSLEEWEYVEEHQDLYKDIITEKPQTLTSQDRFVTRNTLEGCPSPLSPQTSAAENHNYTLYDHDFPIVVKAEIIEVETYTCDDQQCKTEDTLIDRNAGFYFSICRSPAVDKYGNIHPPIVTV